MQPGKHYETDAIQAEIDNSQENPAADESTLRRWRAEFHQGKDQIEGVLRALWSESLGLPYPLLPQDSLLQHIREHWPRWLRFVHKALINQAFDPHTRFAFVL